MEAYELSRTCEESVVFELRLLSTGDCTIRLERNVELATKIWSNKISKTNKGATPGRTRMNKHYLFQNPMTSTLWKRTVSSKTYICYSAQWSQPKLSFGSQKESTLSTVPRSNPNSFKIGITATPNGCFSTCEWMYRFIESLSRDRLTKNWLTSWRQERVKWVLGLGIANSVSLKLMRGWSRKTLGWCNWFT